MNLSQITILLSNTISFSLGFTCIAYVLTLSLTTKKISFGKLFSCLGITYLIISLTFIFAGIPGLIFTLFLYLTHAKIPLIKNIFICVLTFLMVLVLTFITNMVFYAMKFSPDQIEHLREMVSYNIFFSIEWIISSLIISCVIYFLSYKITRHHKKMNFINHVKPDKTIYLIFINVLFLVIIIAGVEFAIATVDTSITKYILIFCNILTLTSIVFSTISIWLELKIISNKSKEIELEKKQEITSTYRREIQNMYNEIIDFKHDYIKIYSSMSTLIASDNLKMIKDFFYKEILPFHNSILKDVTFTHSITLIEDSIIQGIIYSYVLKAKNNSINFNIDIQENINIVSEISSLDMSRILGILLDNASEEAVKTESKNVILSIIPLKTQIIYVIKNSCNTVPDISKIFLNNYSTKGENHGRGLSIVQNICNNYSNVFFNVKIQDNFFLSELIINTVD